MAHKKSIGRKASEETREAASFLCDIYGPALTSPTGRYCVNPDDEPEDQVFVTTEQAGRALLDAIQRLARTGYLVDTEVDLERFTIREYYKLIKSKGKTSKEAIAELGKVYFRSERDLQRQVGNDKR